jgi:hypothetical protein
VAHALGAQPLHDALGVRAQLVGLHDHPCESTVDPDEHVCLAGTVAGNQRGGADLVGVIPLGAQEGAAADRHAMPVEAAGDPLAGLLANLAGHF